MRSIIVLIFFSVFAFAGYAKANTLEKFQEYKEQQIFRETLITCHSSKHYLSQIIFSDNNLNSFLISSGQSLMQLFSGEMTEQVLQDQIQKGLLGDYTSDRLRSFAFHEALQMCFPGNPLRQKHFVISMMISDILGKVPTVFAAMAIFEIFNRTLSPFNNLFPKLSVFMRWAIPTAGVLLAIVAAKKTIQQQQLTMEEKYRTESLRKELSDQRQLFNTTLREEAEKTLQILEKRQL